MHGFSQALCYKPEDLGFYSRLGYWIFSIHRILTATLDWGGVRESNNFSLDCSEAVSTSPSDRGKAYDRN
jgi:hypothetical protein